MQEEIARLARHVLPPAISFAVASGWIPASLQQPLVEAAIAVGAVIAALAASRKAAKRAAK